MGSFHDRLKEKIAGDARQTFGWKPKDGDNRIFVLPPAAQFVQSPDAVTDLAVSFRAHFFKFEGRKGEASRCLQDFGDSCPACAVSYHYRNSVDPALKEMARQVRAANQYLFNILDLNDTAKGVQRWAANKTCKDAIYDIAANPAWGYVFDPTNGRIFVVTVTPPKRGGNTKPYNDYKVRPEPQPVTVLEILMAGEKGLQALDGLEQEVMEAKSVEDIQKLVDEMGFPPLHGGPAVQGARPIMPTPMPVAPGAVAPPAPTMPLPSAPAPAAPVPVPAPSAPVTAAAAPVPVPHTTGAPAPTQPTAAPPSLAPSTPAAPVVSALGTVYDPGPNYVEKVPLAQRPNGAPRCYGDYDPTVHQCVTCSFAAPCRMKLLGIGG